MDAPITAKRHTCNNTTRLYKYIIIHQIKENFIIKMFMYAIGYTVHHIYNVFVI
jgi:hypothetical protein